MTTETSSIDDLLISHKTGTQPQTPEHDATVEIEADAEEAPEIEASNETTDDYGTSDETTQDKAEARPGQAEEIDDYGNPKAASKTYTEDEVNERINRAVRERFARMERNGRAPSQEQAQTQAQSQTQQGFQYNEDSAESWQQQLESFVEQTVSRMSQKQAAQAQQHREHQALNEFQEKLDQGMERFKDFRETLQDKPITDPMMMAARSMKDPAAFLYAASKRAPKELQRIAEIADPYAQIAEMGKLEEKMKRTKPSTSAPKPVSRTHEDSPLAHKADREPTIEELIAKSDAKRRALQNARRR